MTAKIKAQNNKFFDHAITKLKENDFKLTKSRIDILTTLSKHEQALSPYQIQDILKETNGSRDTNDTKERHGYTIP